MEETQLALDDATKTELTIMLGKMENASSAFYSTAVRIGMHQFIELNGLIRQMIIICQDMLREGIDFRDNQQRPKDHQAYYIGEKINCMWGTALGDNKQLFLAFMKGVLEIKSNTMDAEVRAALDAMKEEISGKGGQLNQSTLEAQRRPETMDDTGEQR